jgi:hypothetical protein
VTGGGRVWVLKINVKKNMLWKLAKGMITLRVVILDSDLEKKKKN